MKTSSSSGAFPRLLIASTVVLLFAALALRPETEEAAVESEPELQPIALEATCALAGDAAHAHARMLEQKALAHWERVPFALEEAPYAASLMGEAEACYALTEDRTGRLRAGGRYAAYVAEIERRFARARLLLRVALRDERVERVREEVMVLSALLARAPESTREFRAELEQLGRTYAATARESEAEQELHP